MATQLQLRRGTTSENASFTGAVGEVTVDTTKDTLIVQDGSTAGGHELAKADGTNITGVDSLENGGNTKVLATSTGIDVTGEIAANGGIALGDNDRIKLGDGPDLQIWHNGSDSYVMDSGTGNLKLLGSAAVEIQSQADNSNMIVATAGGAVTLYNANAPKLATTATGIDVTGKVSSDGLEVDLSSSGNVELTGAANSNAGLVVRDPTATAYGAHFSYDDANTVVSIGGQTNGTKNTAISIGRDTNDISFYEDTGTTPKLTWDASAEMLTTSGLTVAANTATFSAGTSGNMEVVIQADTDNNDEGDSPSLVFKQDGGNTIGRVGLIGNNNDVFTGSIGNSLYIGNDEVANLQLYTSLKERMRISSIGDISFYEDTGTTPRLFWDASAERLGIGTASPNRALHVSTSDNLPVFVESTDGLSLLGIGDSEGSVAVAANGSSFSVYTGGDAGGYTSFGSERMSITSDGEIRTSNAVIVGRLADRQAQTVGVTDATIVLAGNSSTSGAGEEIGKVAFYNQDSSGFGQNLAATIKALTSTAIGAKADLVFSTKQGAAEGAEALETMRISSNGSCRWTPDGTNPDMTLTEDGNLLVGKASTSSTTVGAEIRPEGRIFGTTDNQFALLLNRTSTDGDIAVFRKDSTTVGSIGTGGGDVVVASRNNKGFKIYAPNADGTGAILHPSTDSSGNPLDAKMDLGYSSGRFKDVYLSGGVYLGGTGAANKLDDYEEGSWTPVYSAQTGSFTTLAMDIPSATYTKIGNTVVLRAFIRTDDVDITGASGALRIAGLPFSVNKYQAVATSYALGGNWTNPISSGYADIGGFIALLKAGELTATPQDMISGTTANKNSLMLEVSYQTTV